MQIACGTEGNHIAQAHPYFVSATAASMSTDLAADACSTMNGAESLSEAPHFEFPTSLASLSDGLTYVEDPLRPNAVPTVEKDTFSFGSSTTNIRDNTPLLSPPSEGEQNFAGGNYVALAPEEVCYRVEETMNPAASYSVPREQQIMLEEGHEKGFLGPNWNSMSHQELLEQLSALNSMFKASAAEFQCSSQDATRVTEVEMDSPKSNPVEVLTAQIAGERNQAGGQPASAVSGAFGYSNLIDMICSRTSISCDTALKALLERDERECELDSEYSAGNHLTESASQQSCRNALLSEGNQEDFDFEFDANEKTKTNIDSGEDRTGKDLGQSAKIARIEQSNAHLRRKPRTYSRPIPSQHCHICSRRPTDSSPHAACGNLGKGRCRKTICQKCFILYGWNLDEARDASRTGWVCPHCRNECPERAQCHIYDRTSERRRNKTVNHRKPKMLNLMLDRNRKRNPGTMEIAFDDPSKRAKQDALVSEMMIDDAKVEFGENPPIDVCNSFKAAITEQSDIATAEQNMNIEVSYAQCEDRNGQNEKPKSSGEIGCHETYCNEGSANFLAPVLSKSSPEGSEVLEVHTKDLMDFISGAATPDDFARNEVVGDVTEYTNLSTEAEVPRVVHNYSNSSKMDECRDTIDGECREGSGPLNNTENHN